MELRELLEQVQAGRMTIEKSGNVSEGYALRGAGICQAGPSPVAALRFRGSHLLRRKSMDHLVSIYQHFAGREGNVLGTRASREQYEAVRQALPDIEYDELSGILVLQRKKPEPIGCVAVCTGGTSDISVAEEAARTAEYFGSRVERIYDVGVAGIHRLLANTEHLRAANCIIAVAAWKGLFPA